MSWIWYIFISLVALVLIGLQAAFFPYLPMGGVIIQIVPIFLLGLVLYRTETFLFFLAFSAGLLLDLLSLAPLGSSSIGLLCALIVIYPFSGALERYRLPASLILGMVGMLTYFFASNLTLRFLGVSLDWSTMTAVPRMALIHAFGAVVISLVLGIISELFGRNRRKNSFL